MKKYLVAVREVYENTVEVQAENEDQAKDLAYDLSVKCSVNTEYSHTLGKDTWSVEEVTDDGKNRALIPIYGTDLFLCEDYDGAFWIVLEPNLPFDPDGFDSALCVAVEHEVVDRMRSIISACEKVIQLKQSEVLKKLGMKG